MKIQEKSTSDRKREHIELATRSQKSLWSNDKRFFYEPLLGTHPTNSDIKVDFLPKKMKFPLWVSSMTGGTDQARKINENLAAACREFGLGMGLGSCRIMLEEPEIHRKDFAIREFMGDSQPLFANLGIAQMEKIIQQDGWKSVERMLDILEADGLTIHVNPLQEWLQPEGDVIQNRPIDTIKSSLQNLNCPIIVKEVGQGMGPESLMELMKLPVVIEFGAYGGTNFSQLEINRSEKGNGEINNDLSNIGHNAEEMTGYINGIMDSSNDIQSKGFIISGGIKNYLDGYYFMKKLNAPSIYGQASTLLKYAMSSEKDLLSYVEQQISGFNLAKEYLKIRE